MRQREFRKRALQSASNEEQHGERRISIQGAVDLIEPRLNDLLSDQLGGQRSQVDLFEALSNAGVEAFMSDLPGGLPVTAPRAGQ